jgi:hypothetical protein
MAVSAVVAVTALGSLADLHATREAGFAAHVLKPIQWEPLMRTIQRVLLRPRPRSRAAATSVIAGPGGPDQREARAPVHAAESRLVSDGSALARLHGAPQPRRSIWAPAARFGGRLPMQQQIDGDTAELGDSIPAASRCLPPPHRSGARRRSAPAGRRGYEETWAQAQFGPASALDDPCNCLEIKIYGRRSARTVRIPNGMIKGDSAGNPTP